MTSFLFLLAMISMSTCNESLANTCPKVNVIKPFEVTKFLGVWYQFAISGDLFKNPCEKSVTLEWALSGKNITITTYRICSKGMICRRKQTIWKAELGDPDEKTGQIDGKLNLFVNRPEYAKATVELLVLNTNYVHSAVLYTCSVNSNRTLAIWILTRKQKPTDMEMADILTTVDATLETNHLDQFEFRLTNPQCESVVKGNSKNDIREPASTEQELPSSATNALTTLETNSRSASNSSNDTSSNEINKSKLNSTSSSEVNHNKTHGTLEQKRVSPVMESSLKQKPTNNSIEDIGLNTTLDSPTDKLSMSKSNDTDKTNKNVLYSILENLHKEKPQLNNFTNIGLNRTFNSNIDKVTSSNGKGKSGKNGLYSVLENFVPEKLINNNSTKIGLNRALNHDIDKLSSSNGKDKSGKNVLYSVLENFDHEEKPTNNNRLNKLPIKYDKLSRRDRNNKLSKLGMFEPEQTVSHSFEENPTYDHNRLSQEGNIGNRHSGTEDLRPEPKTPEEGFFPSLAHTFFKNIPKAFNFDLWRI